MSATSPKMSATSPKKSTNPKESNENKKVKDDHKKSKDTDDHKQTKDTDDHKNTKDADQHNKSKESNSVNSGGGGSSSGGGVENGNTGNGSEDPFEEAVKDDMKFKILKKLIIYLCIVITVFAFQYFVLGILAIWLYKDKVHLFVFGMICILHLFGAPLGYLAIKKGNRYFFLALAILNLLWIVLTVLLIILYLTIIDSEQFPKEAALHIGCFFYIIMALTLAICCFLMMKKLDMINVQMAAPKVKASMKGNASKK